MKAHVKLYEAPILTVHVGGEDIALSMAKTDTTEGHRLTMQFIDKIETRMKDQDYDKALGAIADWMLYLFGKDYEKVFATEEARKNFTWHKSLYAIMVDALAKSHEGFMQDILQLPALVELKEGMAKSLIDAVSEVAESAGTSNDN